MLLLSTLLALAPSMAHDCGTSNLELVTDIQGVAQVGTQDSGEPAVAPDRPWADELEQGWEAVKRGKLSDARTLASAAADLIREAAALGTVCEEEQQALLAEAWRLWALADGLTKADSARGREAMDQAHETAELARRYAGYGQITEAQRDAVLAQAWRLYEEAKNGGTSIVNRVPWFSQYDNGIDPGGSCQNTSLAMALGLYGVDVRPDEVSRRYGTDLGKSPEGVARIFNAYASEEGIAQRIRYRRDGSVADMKRLLDEGKPVIVHGYFTGSGHVVVVTGYDDTGYFVNDPAGVWSERWKGGYQGSYNGRGVHYGARAFEVAVGTWDGSTPAPLWYGEVYTP
jgi:hypothetical protein